MVEQMSDAWTGARVMEEVEDDVEQVAHSPEDTEFLREAMAGGSSLEHFIARELMLMPVRNRNQAAAMWHLSPGIARHLAPRVQDYVGGMGR